MADILVIMGNRNKLSRNYKLHNRLLKKLNNDIAIETISFTKYPMLECVGCCKCFNFGQCILDGNNNDNGKIIKEKISDSKVIIFNSPVFANNVSSDIKKLIDRTSYWLHIFKLIGKKVIILTTTDLSGADTTNDYLKNICIGYGLIVPLVQTYYAHHSFSDEEKQLNEVKQCIIDCLEGNYDLFITEKHESTFQYFKFMYATNVSTKESYEKLYWEENNYFKAESFKELIQQNLYEKI